MRGSLPANAVGQVHFRDAEGRQMQTELATGEETL